MHGIKKIEKHCFKSSFLTWLKEPSPTTSIRVFIKPLLRRKLKCDFFKTWFISY